MLRRRRRRAADHGRGTGRIAAARRQQLAVAVVACTGERGGEEIEQAAPRGDNGGRIARRFGARDRSGQPVRDAAGRTVGNRGERHVGSGKVAKCRNARPLRGNNPAPARAFAVRWILAKHPCTPNQVFELSISLIQRCSSERRKRHCDTCGPHDLKPAYSHRARRSRRFGFAPQRWQFEVRADRRSARSAARRRRPRIHSRTARYAPRRVPATIPVLRDRAVSRGPRRRADRTACRCSRDATGGTHRTAGVPYRRRRHAGAAGCLGHAVHDLGRGADAHASAARHRRPLVFHPRTYVAISYLRDRARRVAFSSDRYAGGRRGACRWRAVAHTFIVCEGKLHGNQVDTA